MSSESGKTIKIRKQPRRTSRKQLRPYFRNPLQAERIFMPSEIRNNIIGLEYLCIRNMDDLIPIPGRADGELLDEMRKAVTEQEKKISEFSSKETTARRPSESNIIDPIWSEPQGLPSPDFMI